MNIHSVFSTILFFVFSLFITNAAYSYCTGTCEGPYNLSGDDYALGAYNISVLQSYKKATLAQAVLDSSEIEPEPQKSVETDTETETEEYESILLEAAEHAKDDADRLGAGGTAKDWQVFISLYLWLSGLNGEITQGDTTTDVDVSFGDIWENFDIGGQAHVELWWKKWLFYIDPTYMKLTMDSSQSRTIGALRAKSQVKLFLFEFGGGYRVAEVALSENTKSNDVKTWPLMNVDLYAGGRILSVDSKVNFTLDTPLGPLKQTAKTDEAWLDLLVGTRLLFYLSENFIFSAKTDIGGFGLGFSSDISWNFVTNVGYELPWWGVTPYVGYRVLYINYKDGKGDNRFVYDVWQTGPQVGVGIRF